MINILPQEKLDLPLGYSTSKNQSFLVEPGVHLILLPRVSVGTAKNCQKLSHQNFPLKKLWSTLRPGLFSPKVPLVTIKYHLEKKHSRKAGDDLASAIICPTLHARYVFTLVQSKIIFKNIAIQNDLEHQKKDSCGFPYRFYRNSWDSNGIPKKRCNDSKGFQEKCGDCTGVIENRVGIPNRNPTPPYLSLWQGMQSMRVQHLHM